jgi:HSP20 family protein
MKQAEQIAGCERRQEFRMQGKAKPISDEERLRRRVERLFGGPAAGWTSHHHPHAWRPPTDVHETESAFTVVVEAAGMRQSEFKVSLDDNLLTISGVRPNPAPRAICHQMEIYSGEFRTEIYLVAAIDADGIEATYADGFLTVTLPKARTRRIPVVTTSHEPVTKVEPHRSPDEPRPPHLDADASS